MANYVSNTPIRAQNYSSRALIGDWYSQPRACLIQPDGTLWVAMAVGTAVIHLFRSTDNGFSWEVVHRGACNYSNLRTSPTTNFDGPAISLIIDEMYDNLDVIYAGWENLGDSYLVRRARYVLSTIAATDTPTYTDLVALSGSDIFDGCFRIDSNNNEGYLVYGSLTNTMKLKLVSPRTTSVSAASEAGDTLIWPMIASRATKEGIVHLLYQRTIADVETVRYAKFTESSLTFSGAVSIEVMDADHYMHNPLIDYDGYGTILVVYDNEDEAVSVQPMYSYSIDNGVNFSTPAAIPTTTGHTPFLDSVATVYTSNPDIIGGRDGGFLISYTRFNASSIARTYVRRLSTTDGTTYTLGDEKEIGVINYSGQHITGGKFFKPISSHLLDLSDPGLARIAFSVGVGNDIDGLDDTKPVIIAQELLSYNAYSSILSTDTTTYTIDTPDANNILVVFNNIGGLSENVDYYALGLTGNFTTRYISAFNRLGNSIHFLKYEPDVDNLMNDRSAYGSPTEYSEKVLLDPQSYQFPTPAISAADFTQWVEKDVRKLYLPPTFHLSRQFLVNLAGYLKRTVWLCEYGGNQYELSQVIPHFINNQIAYYEANAYVVGPSNDPFSRTILPSET